MNGIYMKKIKGIIKFKWGLSKKTIMKLMLAIMCFLKKRLQFVTNIKHNIFLILF